MKFQFNWSKMTKEQKQIVILSAMILMAGIFALYQFVLVPMIDKGKLEANELAALRNQLDQADRIVKGKARLSRELQEVITTLDAAEKDYIAPMGNALTWISEKVYEIGRNEGVDIQSVAAIPAPAVPWATAQRAGVKTDRIFVPYAVRIVSECSFVELIRLITALEESNPYLCINGMSITAQDRSPEKHAVDLTVQWPMGSIEESRKLRSKQRELDAKKEKG